MSIVIDSKLWGSNTTKLSDKVILLLLKYKQELSSLMLQLKCD